jgi:hypothetical protein
VLSATSGPLEQCIADGENKLGSASVIQHYQLGNLQTITRNKLNLQELDMIDKTRDSFGFVDPVFEIWFMKGYR